MSHLLGQVKKSGRWYSLHLYITAVCYPKMLHQWTLILMHWGPSLSMSGIKVFVIRILTPPHVCMQMLPWDALLESPHFPNDLLGWFDTKTCNSTEDVTKFLHNWSKPQSSQFLIEDVLKVAKPLEDHCFQRWFYHHHPVSYCSAWTSQNQGNVWSSYIDTTMSRLQHLHECPPSEWCNSVCKIILMIKTLRDNVLFFNKLRQEPLSSGKSFNGTCHCELILASLISLAQTSLPSDPKYAKYGVTLEALKASHILLYSLVLFNLLCFRMFQQLLECPTDAAQCTHICSMPYWQRAGKPQTLVIHLDSIVHLAHLLPICGDKWAPRGIKF